MKIPPLTQRKSSATSQFESLVRPHILPLYRTAYKLTGSQHDAEDIVQDVLVKLYRKNYRLQNIEDLRSWLMRVTYNQFVDFCRKVKRNPALGNQAAEANGEEPLDDLPDPGSEPEWIVDRDRQSEEVLGALDVLPPEQRALVIFHLMDGYKLDELTDLFDVPLGTLKSRLHRTKAALKKLLQVEPLSSIERDKDEVI